ncbi:MAG TPA: DUF4058 family protein [Planctomycetaceae bacterium]|nr:DUF4058 family protein [Planctomycetaceae bacterium]
MPSPFPGMDPWLEAPDIWPDLHEAFAAEIRRELNRRLPARYYARLEMRPEIGIVGDADEPLSVRRIVPDVALAEHEMVSTAAEAVGTAVLAEPRMEVSPSVEVRLPGERLKHQFVEIRDADRDHALVTLLEIASPANKRRGADRDAYLMKQSEVLDSDVSLVEIDLLRGGDRLIGGADSELLARMAGRHPDYLVGVSRSWRRAADSTLQVFACTVRETLPCIPVPLREGEAEVVLDLQYCFQQAYDAGPYRRGAVDYRQPPRPPLSPEDTAWAAERLEAVTCQSD